MRRLVVMIASIVALMALALPVQAAAQYRSVLLGANEVGGGDVDGFGGARVTFGQNGEVCFEIQVRDVAPIAAAHIHEAPAGVNGPVVVDFDVANNGLVGCVVADPAVLRAIRANPAGYYFNLHNADFPGGALRGQLG